MQSFHTHKVGEMDYKLMRDFEELEGLSDQVDEDADASSTADEDEDDPSFRPTMAANLNNADIYYEVRKNAFIY